MGLLVVSLLLGPFSGEFGTIGIVILVGLCTWSSHGSVTTLASIVKMNSSTMQQIGFAFPGVVSIILVQILDLEGEVPRHRLVVFYVVTAALVIPGLIAWVRNIHDKGRSIMLIFHSFPSP
jgi:hypothetical protein